MRKLEIFINRLKKIGITISLIGNYPWVYLDTINNNKITEKFQSEHGFVIGYSPIRLNQEFSFTDLTEIFNIIKKYK